MSTPKTPTPNLNAKLNEDDVALLDRIQSLATLKGWPGEWKGHRGKAVRAIMDQLVSRLPDADRQLLEATEVAA